MACGCAVCTRSRAGVDSGGATAGRHHDGGYGRDSAQRLVSRERRVSDGTPAVEGSAVAALSETPEGRASPQETRDSRKRIRELERDLRRKDKALAETAALLVLSKQ